MVPAKLPALLMRSLLHFCLFKTKYLPFLRVFSRERLTYVYKKKRKTFFFLRSKLPLRTTSKWDWLIQNLFPHPTTYLASLRMDMFETSQLLIFGYHHSAKLIFRVIFFWHDEALLI